mgnify:CR=1 FL=1
MTLNSQNKVGNNTVELVITVSPDVFEAEVEKSYKKNVMKMNIPGFRKGKAPRKMIEKMYGADVFYDDAVNAVYPEAYEEAIKEAKITPVDRASVEIISVDSEGFKFKATVTVKPEVEIKDYKGIKVEKDAVKVSASEVDSELEAYRKRQARLIDAEEDAVTKNGDSVTFDFEGFVDGKAFEGGKAEDFSLVLGSGQFIPGFEDQMIGKKAGEKFTVNVKFPEDYHAAEFAGKEATFKVTVKGVRSSFLPELSDEVVQKISQCKTVAEFEEFVRKSIHDFKQNQADMEKENKVLEQIVEASEIEVPQEFIDERKEQLKNNLLAQLRNAGNTFEQYLQYNGLTEELFEEYAAKDALSMLKGQAVLQEIAKAEGFSYTDEDVDQTIAAMAMSYQMPAEQLREMMGERGVAMVAEDILSKQALEFIVKEAVEA